MKRLFYSVIMMALVLGLAGCQASATPAATAEPIAEAPAAEESGAIASAPQNTSPSYPMPEATAAPAYAMPTQGLLPTLAVPAPNNGMDNYFQDYGVNPMTSTDRDNLSTFALDVDTASYRMTVNYINEGSMPPMDAVRTEEFVNAFDQGYAAPENAAFTLYADGAPSPFVQSGSYLLRFGVQGYRVPEYMRKPLYLTFVVDVSGSMDSENRLGMVRDSLHLLVDRLNDQDIVTIVAYSTDAWMVLEPTRGNDQYTIDRAIDSLYPHESTNADAGLRLGYRYAYRMYNPEATNRVILCSDGVANEGNTSPDSMLEYIRQYADGGITLTGIGVGMGNYNDVLMEQLADGGDGNYYYVDTMDQAREVFVENMVSTVQVIAYDAKIQIDFNPEVVASYRLIGYENRDVADEDFRDDSVDAGEIGAGMTATALYEVQLRPGSQGRIATAQLRWQDADTREVTEIDGNFYTNDLAYSFEDTSPYFQLSSTVAAYAELLRASPYVQGDLRAVADQAKRIARLLVESEQANEFADLAVRTADLDYWGW